MTREVFRWVCFVSSISTLIPLICLFIYRNGQPRQNMILGISLCISLIFDVIGFTMGFVMKMSNTLSNNLYFIISFPAIMIFYHEIVTKRSLKILIRIFTLGFMMLALISALHYGLNVVNSAMMTLSSILITVTSLVFVADLNLMDPSNFSQNPFHKTNILLNTSLALYYFITIIIFATADYVYSLVSVEDARYFWASHNAAHMLKNVGIAVAFYLSAKRSLTLRNHQTAKVMHRRVRD